MASSLPPPQGDPRDTKNLFIAIVLSLVVIVGWQYIYEKPRQDALKAQQAEQQLQTALTSAATDVMSVPVPATDTAPTVTAALADVPGALLTREQALAQAPRVKISSDQVHGSINLQGARFDDLTLARYRESLEKDSPEITLLSPSGAKQPYFAEFGWRAAAGVPAPDATSLWSADKQTLAAGEAVTLSWNNGAGLVFERKVALDDKYMFTITDTVRNESGANVSLHPYALVARNFDPGYDSLYLQHEGPIGIMQGQLVEHEYKKLAENKIETHKSTGGWVGFTDKYWLVAAVPDQKAAIEARMLHVPQVSSERFQVDYMAPAVALAAGQSHSQTTHLFAGAKEVRTLDRYQDELGIPKFDLAVDFGWFYFLTKPFFYALDLLSLWLGSFGLAILAFTVLLKLALFKLADHSYISMAKMKNLMPKMTEIRETYNQDPARQSQEMMALYKKEGINPMSGCWPVLIQIPIFFALYKVLYVAIEMRHAPFYGWIEDLSAMDPSNLFTLFGLLGDTAPLGIHIGFWPLLMGITMWLQMKMSPPPTDPTQKMVLSVLPFILTISMAQFAVGMVIYWTWSNILSIAQQYVIMRRMKTRIL
jgi:YidC/Oxa1 family membrane protein insertase